VQPAAWRAKDGRLWFSTNHGLIVIDPDHLQWILPHAKVEVEEVIVNGQSRSLPQVRDLAPGKNNLEFRYTCLSYQVPLRITFRYKLDGFDKDWIDAGSRRQAFYTNLPPGPYRFEVMANNIDGVWSEAAVAALMLEPHFYQRAGFIPLCVGLAAALVVLGIRQRIGGIKRQMRAILTERSRIARELHDTLLQGFSGVTMEMQALATRLQGGQQRSTLEEIILDAGNCMREARRSVAGLRNGPGSALATAIAQTARQLTEARDIRLKLKLEQCAGSLGAEVEYNLLRIAQEALTNCVRHSGAKQVEVSLSCTTQRVSLAVSDDGVGFSAGDGGGPGPGHYGLIGMKERASQIGAKLELETSPGGGTAVRVELPMPKPME
jgi:signal transduction histidine kinase